jgi:UDP-3-O-[3-hydroxymyristoyl] N-acetylglucosamine deacetylase / 3-hydroxyacyl-[acyl-carrier-protein] dehydratase
MTCAVLSGRALHSGVPSTVRIVRRADDGLGIRFMFPGFTAPLTARDLSALTRSVRRATVLSHGSGAVIRTPEHLLAAALFFAEEPLDIICDADEPPGLDGSARPWFTGLAAVAQKVSPTPEYDTELTWHHTGREGELRAEPAPCFSVVYTLERGSFRETFHLESSALAPAEILPARTFIFWKDWRALSGEKSLLTGAGMDSGLLLAESPEEYESARVLHPECAGATFPLLHPHSYRFEAEAARHKVLDLLGDLALNGLALPKLRLTITNGGHALNHLLLDALQRHGS